MMYSTLLVVLLTVSSSFAFKHQEGSRRDHQGPVSEGDKGVAFARDTAGVLGWLPDSKVRHIQPKPPSEVCKTESDIGLNYFDRCNWCRCADVGEAFCTRKACPVEPLFLPRIRSLPPALMCTEENAGKTYNDGCNSCFCPAGGASDYAGCTRRACLPVLPFEEIELNTTEAACPTESNGTMFYETECSVCICTGRNASWCYDQERPGCILPVMEKSQEHARTRVVSPLAKTRSRGRNNPTAIPKLTPRMACQTTADDGKTYFDGCNWCQCTDIGQAMCTWRRCGKRRH